MRRLFFILIVVISCVSIKAQQFPLQSQYYFNYSSINPAAVGEFDYWRIIGSYRNQWTGFNTQNDQAIATQYITLNKGFGLNGLGLTLLNDNTGGAFNTTGFRLSYSHKVIYDTHKLFFGISGGGTKVNLNTTNFYDAAVLANSDFVREASFGAYVLVKNWKLGFSVPGMLNENIQLTNSSENKIQSQYYTMVSYTHNINDNWTVYPSFLAKNANNRTQFDVNLNVKLRDKIWFGASYRTSSDDKNDIREAFGPSVYLGIDLGRFFTIYSHDISLGDLSSYPTSEITFGYDFISDEEIKDKEVKIQEYTEIQNNDKDKDGVVDTLDLCPEEYGLEIANGCPDADNDGVPDKYDLCPYLFGDLNLQGCPTLTYNETQIVSMALQDLNFDIGKSIIRSESFESLTNLVVLMHKKNKMILFIEGHASSEGTSRYNLNLSAQRAKSVQNFFINRGISKGRLIIDFYGEEAPLNNNNTEEERAKNRRVEFELKYHLYDRLSANSLQQEYDSLLSIIYGEKISIAPVINNDMIPIEEIQNDSILENKNSTLIINQDDSLFSILSAGDSLIFLEDETEIAEVDNSLIISDSITNIIDSQIKDSLDIKDKIQDTRNYFVIVQVFTNLDNANDYISISSEILKYIFHNDKYYVYAFRSQTRNEAERYRNQYSKDCWILQK